MTTQTADLSSFNPLDLLTALVMGEAEAEPLIGKFAVAQVVKNRVADNRWANDWNRVMLQKYQFSCFLPEYLRPVILETDWGNVYWRESRLAAMGVFFGYIRDVADGANHYHARHLDPPPKWADPRKMTQVVGQHIFYKL